MRRRRSWRNGRARDKRVRVYRQDKNIGAVANFDWLLNAAQSRWFMFAAYDDRWSPGYVDALYKAVTRKQGTQLAAPQMVTFFDDGREDIRKAAPVRQNAIADRVARIRFLLKSAHSGWYYGLFDRKFFRRGDGMVQGIPACLGRRLYSVAAVHPRRHGRGG